MAFATLAVDSGAAAFHCGRCARCIPQSDAIYMHEDGSFCSRTCRNAARREVRGRGLREEGLCTPWPEHRLALAAAVAEPSPSPGGGMRKTTSFSNVNSASSSSLGSSGAAPVLPACAEVEHVGVSTFDTLVHCLVGGFAHLGEDLAVM